MNIFTFNELWNVTFCHKTSHFCNVRRQNSTCIFQRWDSGCLFHLVWLWGTPTPHFTPPGNHWRCISLMHVNMCSSFVFFLLNDLLMNLTENITELLTLCWHHVGSLCTSVWRQTVDARYTDDTSHLAVDSSDRYISMPLCPLPITTMCIVTYQYYYHSTVNNTIQ